MKNLVVKYLSADCCQTLQVCLTGADEDVDDDWRWRLMCCNDAVMMMAVQGQMASRCRAALLSGLAVPDVVDD